jgi:YqaJ-like viral recombinase domain
MAATLLMTDEQVRRDPERWHKHRLEGITASEAARMLGVPGAHGGAFGLYAEKKTGVSTTRDKAELRRGKALEPEVVADLEHVRPELTILPGGLYASGMRPWMMATFDRFAVDCEAAGVTEGERRLGAVTAGLSNGRQMTGWAARFAMPVEIKTVHEQGEDYQQGRWGEPGTAQVPDHILAQAYWQMAVWDADVLILPAKFMLSWDTVIYMITRTAKAEADIQWMIGRGEEFLDRLARSDPPPVDWTEDTYKALKTLHPMRPDVTAEIGPGLARRYQRAWQRLEREEQRYGLVRNLVAAQMGDANRAVHTDADGVTHTVMTRSTGTEKRVSVKLVRARYPQIAAECEVESDTDKLIPGRSWVREGWEEQ